MSTAIISIDTGGADYADLVLDWGGEYYRWADLYLDGARNATSFYGDSDAAPGWKWGRYAVYNGVVDWHGEYYLRWLDSAQPQGAPILPTGHPGITAPVDNYLVAQGWFRIATPPTGTTVLGIPSGTDAIAGLEPGSLIVRTTRQFRWFRENAHPSLPVGHALVSVGPEYLYNGQAKNAFRYEYEVSVKTLGALLRLPSTGVIFRFSPTATPRVEINGAYRALWNQSGAGGDDYCGMASDGCVFDQSNFVPAPPANPGRSVLPFDFINGILQ